MKGRRRSLFALIALVTLGAVSASACDPSSRVPSLGHPPPAISGGTLAVLHDGVTAVAADPDRDRVWVADLTGPTLIHEIALAPNDEPGRLVEDGAGRVHVALRRGGALVTIDPRAGSVLARRYVCPAPRGVAYDAAIDAVHVACMDGRIVTLPAAGGAATRTVQIDDDLRDVVVQGGQLYVSRFRSAEVLQLGADGTVALRITLPVAPSPPPMPDGGSSAATTALPSVAYRMVALPQGGLALLHQRAQVEPVSTDAGGYAAFGACPGAGIVQGPLPAGVRRRRGAWSHASPRARADRRPDRLPPEPLKPSRLGSFSAPTDDVAS